MADIVRLQVPMEARLELRAIIGLDDLNAKGQAPGTSSCSHHFDGAALAAFAESRKLNSHRNMRSAFRPVSDPPGSRFEEGDTDNRPEESPRTLSEHGLSFTVAPKVRISYSKDYLLLFRAALCLQK